MELLKVSLRSIFAQRLRSALVVLGVAVGVVAVGGMTAAAVSIRQAVKQQLSSLGAETFVVVRISPLVFVRGSHRRDWRKLWRRPRLKLSYLKPLVDGCSSCERIAPVATYAGKTATLGKRKLEDVSVVGTTPQYNGLSGVKLAFGRFIDERDVDRKRYVCVIGQTVLDELFGKSNPIGRRIRLGGIPFVVVGVADSVGSAFGEDKDNFVVVPITTALHHWRGWWGIQYVVRAKAGAVSSAKEEVISVLRRLRRLKAYEDNDFDILTADMLLSLLTTIIAAVYAVGFAISLASLVVAGIGIMNIMFVVVSERTREIGIRKACGATPGAIMAQFTLEAMLLGLLGGVLGIGILYIISAIISGTIPFDIKVSFGVAVFGLLFSAACGVIFGIFPARRAARLNPVDALRWNA